MPRTDALSRTVFSGAKAETMNVINTFSPFFISGVRAHRCARSCAPTLARIQEMVREAGGSDVNVDSLRVLLVCMSSPRPGVLLKDVSWRCVIANNDDAGDDGGKRTG